MATQKETPVIPMGEQQPAVEAKQPSYEQLQKKLVEVVRTCQAQQQQLEAANYIIGNKQLDYLFRALDHADKFPEDFVTYCANEIMSAMRQTETTEEPAE